MTRVSTTTILLMIFLAASAVAETRPNVILIMTDDQGYGDLGCHGNPVLKTPNLDQLYRESVRFTDFHVSPFCTPTRAALMTGRYPARTGAYRTSSGRTMMHTDERTMANLFADAGYVTGMVGKWHLGDNAPHRPQDRGFQDVVWHHAGGIGQAADYYGNDYFDDTYERNGVFEKFEGYCTDVFFSEAMRFVQENKENPFFLYLATNAPHSPYQVDRKWSDPYKETVKWKQGAEFYGMIANIDHNVGLLRKQINELGIADNTIFIFMTDNGTSKGMGGPGPGPDDFRGFNAGMRGQKSTVFEGGHRVPFFIHWPAGGITGGRDTPNLSAHIDVLPTLAELCNVSLPESLHLDGKSFAAQLRDTDAAPHRNHFITQLHGGARFVNREGPWDTSCVVKERWRLLDGKKLYNLETDPMQKRNIAAKHPDKVAELRAIYMEFWESVSPRMTPVSIDLGSPEQNPTLLCSQDWYLPVGNPPWHMGAIHQLVRVTGPWYVDVKKAGRYRISLRQFPPEANRNVVAVRAKVRIAGKEMESEVVPDAEAVDFEMDLPAGKTKLETWLFDDKGQAGGAYFTEVERLDAPPGVSFDFQPSPEDRAAWLDEAKYGLFIHWGLYSQLARGEWVMFSRKMPIEEYSRLATTFNPVRFDANEWVRVAKDAGMKYLTVTSKHHDGFALFDSDASAYNVVDGSPFQRDVIQELKAACDEEGIKLCLYYSHAMDWYHRGGMPQYNWNQPLGKADFEQYLETVSLPQVREIVSRYQPAVVWFDTPRRISPAIARRFAELVRSAHSDTLISSRLVIDGNKAAKTTRAQRDLMRDVGVDFMSYADREIPAASPWPYWETCMTLNESWGFSREDQAWKSPARVIQQLIEVVSKGGSFLLNVGPDKEGEIPPAAVEILREVGDWLKVNGEAVYSAQPTQFDGPGAPTKAYLAKKAGMEKRAKATGKPVPHLPVDMEYEWLATGQDGKIYICLFDWPGESFTLEGFEGVIKDAYFLLQPEAKLKTNLRDNKLTVTLPAEPAGELVPVLCLEVK